MSGREIVLRGGRVIDPASGFDAVADVAIGDGRVARVGAGLPAAEVDVDVAGLVVTAGLSTCTVTSATWRACACGLRELRRDGPGGLAVIEFLDEDDADADVVVFDPATLTDRATYTESTRPSAGIRHVLVGGSFVVRDGSVVADARPGRSVRAEPR